MSADEREWAPPHIPTCEWPGCSSPAPTGVHGRMICHRHQPEALRQIVLAGPGGPPDETGRPRDRRWLNSFAQLVERVVPEEDRRGLTKGKVQERSVHFALREGVIEFSIERHPAGFVNEQRWQFNAHAGRLARLSERLVESDFTDPRRERSLPGVWSRRDRERTWTSLVLGLRFCRVA